MFERWALTEERLDPDSRTRMIQSAADYEAIAEFAGPDWKASDTGPRSLLQFLADKEEGWIPPFDGALGRSSPG